MCCKYFKPISMPYLKFTVETGALACGRFRVAFFVACWFRQPQIHNASTKYYELSTCRYRCTSWSNINNWQVIYWIHVSFFDIAKQFPFFGIRVYTWLLSDVFQVTSGTKAVSLITYHGMYENPAKRVWYPGGPLSWYHVFKLNHCN